MTANLSSFLIAALFAGVHTQAPSISLNFANTDVSQVLRVIGEKTGASIVYSSQSKLPITIRLDADTAEDAIRGTASAAGLTYRKTGKVYVVAKATELKSALTPYFEHVKLDSLGSGDALSKRIAGALPMAEATPNGRYVLVSGVSEDVAAAREIAVDYRTELSVNTATPSSIIRLKQAPAAKVAQALQALYPNLKITVVSDDAEKAGGALAISGDANDLTMAVNQAGLIDTASVPPLDADTFATYEIRYAASLTLRDFLKEAMPELKVFIAPAHHEPVRATYQNLSGASFSGGSSGSGGGGGGSTGGSAGGSAGGSGGGGGSAGGGGSTGSGGGGSKSSDSGSTDDVDDKSKRLVIRGSSSQIERALKLLQEVDVRPAQVEVDVQVVDASPTVTSETGIDWSWSPFQFEELPSGTAFSGNDGSATPYSTGNTRDAGLGAFSRIPWRVAAALSGLVTKKEARILAKPNVRVLDGDSANVFIGDTLRAKVTSSGAYGAQNVTIETFPVGIQLLIRPRVNADGRITMRVHPVVSTVTSTTDGIPQTNSREAETTVMVKDGETMVIGGLIREEDIKTMREVPILSQLPFFGELFRSRSNEKRKSNILVFITPHVLRDDAPSQEAPKP